MMGTIEVHLSKIISALIVISGGLSVLFAYDLKSTLNLDTAPLPPSTAMTPPFALEELPRLKPKEHYDLIANRNLFVFPKQAGSKGKEESPTDQPTQVTDLNVRLKGTVVSPNGFALAMIEDRSRRDESLYMEGDRIQDAEILEIREDLVILRHAGRDETLKLFAEKPRKQGRWRPPARTTSRRPYAEQRSTRSTGVSGNRRRAQQMVRSLMAQLRLRPHYEKGKPAGFKVGQVRLGSVFQAEGLEKGDIVVAINDEDVRTPNQLLKAYREAAEDEEIWLDIIRDGEEDSVEVDLEEIIGAD